MKYNLDNLRIITSWSPPCSDQRPIYRYSIVDRTGVMDERQLGKILVSSTDPEIIKDFCVKKLKMKRPR